MNDPLTDVGYVVATFAIVALIAWGPTVLVFRHRRHAGHAVRPHHLAAALALELTAVIALGAAVQLAGLQNPQAYVLIIALVIGAAGAQLFAGMRFRGREDSS